MEAGYAAACHRGDDEGGLLGGERHRIKGFVRWWLGECAICGKRTRVRLGLSGLPLGAKY
jgi:hypothetical protein